MYFLLLPPQFIKDSYKIAYTDRVSHQLEVIVVSELHFQGKEHVQTLKKTIIEKVS